MPPRSQPTARQVRLGTELRRLRDAAGLTAREVAELLGSTSAQMSQMESGIAGVSAARVRSLAAHYACGDAALVDALTSMATERTRGWWEGYRGVLPPAFLDLAELEHHATHIQEVGTAHVPGILQTEEYAHAVFSYWRPELPKRALDLRVEHRRRRREALLRDGAAPYVAVLHESVLRIRVADRRVARRQLDAVLRQSESGTFVIRVIPFDADGFAGASAALLYFQGPVPALDTVQQDTSMGSALMDAAAQLQSARTLVRKVESASLGPAETRAHLHHLAKEL
ncbi:Scr1 family TA system antitoxin-like transcriptional regulator [Streptomyces flavofungini]|uniref:Helix-turn-helix domain-containing protein n=1 Tax=Streptomyces flavofungini TaxID=68200 RepID=A0ABS0WY01_9ACTN|nr:Scr1 family TA system antitoxin-like transcriptional regulator [Streptomyces flavofungini]MBJ3805813.1 helix-turn-helix domain-containing protein [Streptomyces flavofungini]GHC75480.1 transcriptional regulator [Streptomyces flavofungini]